MRQKVYRPLVYVCSPYSGNVSKNTEEARKYSRYVVDKGGIAFAPHLLFPQYMDEKTERDLAMHMNAIFVAKCDELWVFGDVITSGMEYEISRAEKLNKKIKYIEDYRKER